MCLSLKVARLGETTQADMQDILLLFYYYYYYYSSSLSWGIPSH